MALAEAARRSAAAMSGRRSNSAEGTANGITGGVVTKVLIATGIENSAGALPNKTAITCSICARCTPISTTCALADLS